MSTRAPITLAMIVRDCDDRLEACLKSVRPFVDEVVIVDTGSTDSTADIAMRYADVFRTFTDCNDAATGLIEDFSLARNKAFSFAKNDWVLWLDSDDVLRGGEHLSELIAALPQATDTDKPTMIMLKYEYDHDAAGNPTVVQQRERLVFPAKAFVWKGGVHEVLVPRVGSAHIGRFDEIVVEHQRSKTKSDKPREAGRNLRILKANHSTRNLFYLGLELGNNGDHEGAIKHLRHYIDVANWDEEKMLAILRLGDHYLLRARQCAAREDWEGAKAAVLQARASFFDAVATNEHWGDGYFGVARCFFLLAEKSQDRRDFERCVFFARLGLTLPAPQASIFATPMEREFEIHRYLNAALFALGDTQGAAESCKAALSVRADAGFEQNLRHYESVLHPKTRRPSTETGEKLRIEFYAGHSPIGPWDPETAKRDGIGGSETAVIEMAQRFSKMGHDVWVWGQPARPGAFDGLIYADADDMAPHDCDVFISSRRPDAFDMGVRAWHNVLWLHDTAECYAGALTEQRALRIDRVFVLSQWHKDNVDASFPFLGEKVTVTRNGIDLSRFDNQPAERIPHRAVYSSSPDRGLERALKLWPRVRDQVPDAELHVFYGFDTWAALRPDDPEIARLKKLIAWTPGAVMRGRVNQATLAQEFMRAGVWFYPVPAFTETSCITALEAQAAGLAIVTSALGALPETVGLHGDYAGTDDGFVYALVSAMIDPPDRAKPRAHAFANFGWDGVTTEWDAMFRDAIAITRYESPGLRAPAPGKMAIAFAYGAWCTGSRLFDIGALWTDPRGLTGSEVSFFSMAREMARRGHTIDVFCKHKPREGVAWEGCRVFDLDDMTPESTAGFDAAYVWNEPDLLRIHMERTELMGPNGKQRQGVAPGVLRMVNQQLNDFTYCQPGWDVYVDVYTSPSDHHRAFISAHTPSPEKWVTLANGVDPDAYGGDKVPGRVIYASSPDRGLHLLLEVWPRILAAVPHATLRVFYNFKPWFDTMSQVPDNSDADMREQKRRAMRIKELIDQPGVTHLHSVSRVDMAKEMSAAEVLAYPCDTVRYTEGFSVTTLEACAAGALPIISDVDALGSIYRGSGAVVVDTWHRDGWREQFAQDVIDALASASWRTSSVAQAQVFAQGFAWPVLAERLEGIILSRKIGDPIGDETRVQRERTIKGLQPHLYRPANDVDAGAA